MARSSSLALATLVAGMTFRVSLAQDSPAPPEYRGEWQGVLSSAFAQLNPSDVNSLQCLAPGTTISTPHSINIAGDGFATRIAPHGAVNVPNVGILPAYKGLSSTWAATSGSVGSLRVSPTTLQCYYFYTTGTGAARKLIWASLGGTGYEWQQQCAPATYAAIADVNTKPYCATPNATSRAPFKSTVLGTYSYKGGGVSGAAARAMDAVVAVVATVVATFTAAHWAA